MQSRGNARSNLMMLIILIMLICCMSLVSCSSGTDSAAVQTASRKRPQPQLKGLRQQHRSRAPEFKI